MGGLCCSATVPDSSLTHVQVPAPFAMHKANSETLPPPPANHILITASFGRILTRKHLSHFLPTRRLNVHPSLLPQYRGPAPIQHSLINGDQETGVCIIEMLPAALKSQPPTAKSGIDAGDIWLSKRFVSSQRRFHLRVLTISHPAPVKPGDFRAYERFVGR